MWRDFEGFNPHGTNSKLATYQYLFAVPFDFNVRAETFAFGSVSTRLANCQRFRLRAHTLTQRQHLGIMKILICVAAVLVSRFKIKRMPF